MFLCEHPLLKVDSLLFTPLESFFYKGLADNILIGYLYFIQYNNTAEQHWTSSQWCLFVVVTSNVEGLGQVRCGCFLSSRILTHPLQQRSKIVLGYFVRFCLRYTVSKRKKNVNTWIPSSKNLVSTVGFHYRWISAGSWSRSLEHWIPLNAAHISSCASEAVFISLWCPKLPWFYEQNITYSLVKRFPVYVMHCLVPGNHLLWNGIEIMRALGNTQVALQFQPACHYW